MSEIANKDVPFYPSIRAFSDELSAVYARGDINDVLTRIQSFVQAIILDRRSIAKVFADSELDQWCQRLGRAIVAEQRELSRARPDEPVDCVILATELYRAGGHSAVVQDLVATGRLGKRVMIILTDALHTADASIVRERFGDSVTCEVAPSGNLEQKLRWVTDRLAALHPRRLLLCNHHHDPVAIAAAQPELADETIFYHHADHQLCLGVTLAHPLHVDPHSMGYYNCRCSLGLKQNVYWPLVVEDFGAREPIVDDGAPLTTCSSGSQNKFDLDYIYRYVDVVPRVMAVTGGRHIHIGPLSDDILLQLHAALDAHGVPRTRFVHVRWVKSLWQALKRERVDVYLPSFPLGGGRAAIEVMGAGVPIIGHDGYVSAFFGGQDMFYREAFSWKTPDQLVEYLKGLTRLRLVEESGFARAHYLQYHAPEALVRAIDAGHAAHPPLELRPQRSDPMQSFLDDVHYAFRDHLSVSQIDDLRRQLVRAEQKVDAIHRIYIRQAAELMEAYERDLAACEIKLAQATSGDDRNSTGRA